MLFTLSRSQKNRLMSATSLLALVISFTGQVYSSAARADEDVKTVSNEPMETVVVTGTKFNTDAAPAKSSLDTTQPQTIVNKSYIEDFVPPTSDFVGILAIAPSMTGTDINGPGLSDGGPKNTLRGLPDGSFGMSYDGIPFGDTNGPTHHSLSFFPATSIGSVLVDRGPGNAGTLGAATYGGTIKMFSDPLGDDLHAKGSVTYGSFNTLAVNVNGQSGALGGANNATHLMVNGQYTRTDGALSFNDTDQKNILVKADHEFGDDWKLTLFSTYNYLTENINDKFGETLAQVAAYGKNFGLQDTNPGLSTYAPYNWVTKRTDMEYARLQGDITDTLKLDDTAYTYMYLNHTFSATSIIQTATDIANNTTSGQGGKVTPIVNGVAQPSDVPGYTKVNAYRVWGNILRLSDDYDFGAVTGQVRAGVWWEGQKTWRSRYDYDRSLCYSLGIDPYSGKDTTPCQDSQLVKGGGAVQTPLGFAEYDEHSSWYQYEPFLEVDIKPFEDLTLTPGVKYINWLHKTNGLEQTLVKYYSGEFTTEKVLPFFEANYKITPSWSVYAQYAQGIYVPDIGSFEQSTGPTTNFPSAETTTNYQIGTVFYADNFTFDGDLYAIPVDNNITYEDCSLNGGLSGDTCAVNTRRALYKGVEGEATYALPKGTMFEGLSVFVNGSSMYARSNGVALSNAPFWTLAGGLLYKHDGWKFSFIDKSVGPQYTDKNNLQLQNYKIGAYSSVSLSAGYEFNSRYELSLSVDNLLDTRSTVAITQKDKTYQTNRLLSQDQYYFQAPTTIMGTIKVHY